MALSIMQHTAPELEKMMHFTSDKAELEKYRIPTAKGAVITRIAARVWPYKFVARILEDLLTSQELSGTFNLQTLTPAESLSHEEDGRWAIETPRGTIKARKLILATNAYTSHLLPQFSDLIVPCRGQMSALNPLPSVSGPEKRLKSSLGFHGEGIDDYLIQRPTELGGHMMFGGGRQHGPSMGITDDSVIDPNTAAYLRRRLIDALDLREGKIAFHEGRFKKDVKPIPRQAPPGGMYNGIRIDELPPYDLSQLDEEAVKHMNKFTDMLQRTERKIGREIEFHAVKEWTGIMGYSRDEKPWVGRVPDGVGQGKGNEGIWMAAGYTGHGMPNTWLCGKTVALAVRAALGGGASGSAAGNEHEQWCLEQAAAETGLPLAYRLSKERMRRAMEEEVDVEVKDWAEMERGRIERGETAAGERVGEDKEQERLGLSVVTVVSAYA
jgi:glycine/D-amino acid oxidase-like deaminating enzyme